MSSNSVCNHTRDTQIGLTRMITDRIGLHSVLLPLLIKVEVSVISRSRRLRLITLTETLIIPDITKTESNNCFIIHCFEESSDKRIIAAITVCFQTLKNVQLSDKQIFTV